MLMVANKDALDVDMDMSGSRGVPMGALLTRFAAESPDAPMLTQGGATLSRAALEARANRRARALAEMGVGEGDVVSIALPNDFEFIETTFALWKLGATPAPLSYRLPDIELAGIVELVAPKLVVGIAAERLSGTATLPAGFEPSAALQASPLPERVSRYWKAVTSGGSTGRPKVVFDHMPSIWDPASIVLGRQPGDTVLNPGPLYHNGPFVLMHTAMLGGSHVVNMPRFDALAWLQLVDRFEVQWGYLVPTMMNRIWRLEERTRFSLESLRMICHMAAPCPAWLKRSFIDWLGPQRVWETYSGTESVGACINNGDEWLARPGTVGRPMGGCKVAILDEAGAALPNGEIGEIYFQPSETSGAGFHYLGGEPRVAGALKGYGDLGYMDDDGYVYIVDRRTDLIVSGGANIYPAEIEAAIEQHPDVRSCVVVGLPDSDLGQATHAIVDAPCSAGKELDAAALLRFLKDRLVTYKHPRSFEFVQSPLRDDAGKVRRSSLRDRRIAQMGGSV
jgi:bile acid-coenzyme A ligase